MRCYGFLGGLLLVSLISGCHFHRESPEGQGGFAEWRWPEATKWNDQHAYPDKIPAAFRVAELRLKQMRAGCAYLYLPAFVTQAEEQLFKAQRAFAGEMYDDSFDDLRQLNARLDEIDRRMEGIFGPRGSYQARGCRSTDPTFQCGHCGCMATLDHYDATCGSCGGGCGGCGESCDENQSRYGCAWQRQPNGSACDSPAPHEKPSVLGPGPATRPGPSASALAERVPTGPLTQVQFEHVMFDFDSDVVLPRFNDFLRDLAARYRNEPDTGFVLHGHTDVMGSDRYNDDLSWRRANSVRDILQAGGISRDRILLRGHGRSEPMADNNTDSGRALNRRVEIYLTDFEHPRTSDAAPPPAVADPKAAPAP